VDVPHTTRAPARTCQFFASGAAFLDAAGRKVAWCSNSEANVTERAAAFFKAWVDRELNSVPYIGEEASGLVAAELALRCLDDAQQAGLDREKIEAEVGDLETYLINKINIAADKEISRMVAKDNQ
jgi:hypothetical protein